MSRNKLRGRSCESKTVTETLLVLDLSGSMSDTDYHPTRLQGAIAASEAFIQEKLAQAPGDRVGMIGFSNSVDHFFSPEVVSVCANGLIGALRRLDICGGTNFCAGLVKTEQVLFNRRQKGALIAFVSSLVGMKKHVLFLSDGFNYGEDPLPVCNRLKLAGAKISCVGIGGEPSEVDEKLLRRMASPNGYRFIRDSQALVQEFRRLANIQVL